MRKSTVLMIRRATKAVADRRSVLGVKGRYFYVALICRELVETAFQTVQVFRMSKYLSRTLLNRSYAVLLAANCWSSVFVYSRLFGDDDARRRFAAIVCDCALDLMSAMGVSILIVLSYVDQYDVELGSFGFELLQDDAWIARMLSEARLVVVASWSDLVARVVFSLGIIASTYSMKELLRWSPRHDNRIAHANGPGEDHLQRFGSVEPRGHENPDGQLKQVPPLTLLQEHATACTPKRVSRVILLVVHGAFFSLGAVVLVLHIQASLKDPLVECSPKVKPIAGALPACFAVEFNCYTLGIAGMREEVKIEWAKFDHTTVAKIHISHCSALEMPDILQEFDQLRELWVYNSTIRSWDANAAITNADHPSLAVFSLVRTNLTDGVLPLGLQSADFPLRLTQIYLCTTNLQTLPDDLDVKWRPGSNIYIEASNLAVVPPALVRLQPQYLSLAGNPFTELPPELFEKSSSQYLILSHSNVFELPRTVKQPPTGPVFYDFADTNVAFFWSWIDPFVESTLGYSPRLAAGGTPYCSDLDKILTGVATHFSSPFQPDFSRRLMNASEGNWEVLRQAVDCSARPTSTQFPLDVWDAQYGVTLPVDDGI
jgi:hypothetical protein